jgi:predicted anti-sigma-YlaC factor YlaD
MHQPIRDNLEEYLRGSARTIPQEFHTHLKACESCASELRLLAAQAEMLRSLQANQEVEPRAGFYARVMDRIEQQGRSSIWSALLDPSFGRRLAMASAALVVLLGTYLVTAERSEPEIANAPDVVMTGAPAQSAVAQDSLQQERDRDAVLVNLAGYRQ